MSAPTHADQRKKALAQSLRNAGIGTGYHNRSLSEDPFPQDLFDWTSDPYADLTAGRGWNFVGGATAYDAAMLTARGLHIQGQGSLVIPCSRLASWVRADAPDLDRVLSVRAVFVTGFYEDHHEPPMQGWVAAGVEEILTERMDNNQSVMLQMGKPLDGDAWWTTRFAGMIANRNRSLTL